MTESKRINKLHQGVLSMLLTLIALCFITPDATFFSAGTIVHAKEHNEKEMGKEDREMDENFDDLDDMDDDNNDDDRRERITAKQIEDTLKHIKKSYPLLLSALSKVKDMSPEEYEDRLHDIAAQYLEAKEDHAKPLHIDLNAYQMTVELYTDIYHRSENKKDKKHAVIGLKKTLNVLFDLRIKEREQDFLEMQEELAELKKPIEKAKASKNKQIQRFIERLLNPTIFE